MYEATSMKILEQRREEMLREAELDRLKKVLRAEREGPAASRWVSTAVRGLPGAIGFLHKFFRTPKNAG